MIELSRSGERKNEKTLVEIDRPVLFNQAYDIYKNDLKYSNEDLARAFALPKYIIDKYFKTDKSKLKISFKR